MPRLNWGRHRAAVSLLVAGSIALFAAEQVLGTVADAATTEAIANSGDYRHASLPRTAPVASSTGMNAAVPAGQYEEPIVPTPIPTVVPTHVPTVPAMPAPTSAPTPDVYESGIASTYGEGDGFEGNLTACGQVFHTSVVQIAHKSLPCGTLVRVEDADSGRSVEAEVTDRGPYVAGRIVDLSWGAFQQLDPSGPGLLHVKIYLLSK